ncbi:hypothetical protein HU675_0011430 [Bradyrhizobium septentrionale]|uniref:hypothetical protein n=1 Tax=Bradyrhizobium septentrionale TaxID=1404411 RepID=UPI001596F979|nr:hypothetical protein [Bradyrhizobium septentrionale]UGY27312.1 hypothetical protein HU675_0011430 [Bradyrhizobium septentrionale]
MTIQDERTRAKLEADAKRLGLSPNTLEMSRAVGTDALRDIVRDNRRNVHDRPGIIPDTPAAAEKPPVGKNGWVEPPKITDWKPPGLDAFERIMDAQDAEDRRERKRRG